MAEAPAKPTDLGKTIANLAAVLGIVITATAGLSTCTKERIETSSTFRQAFRIEEEFWGSLYDKYLHSIADPDLKEPQRRAKLLAIAMLATHKNPDFSEFEPWWDNGRFDGAHAQLEDMRNVLHKALQDQSSIPPEVAQEIAYIFETESALRERDARVEATDTAAVKSAPPPVTAAAQATTSAEISNASPSLARPAAASTVATGTPTGWDVDVFWCAGGDEDAKFARATKVSSALARLADTQEAVGAIKLGRIRLRSLPESVQKRGRFFVNADNIVRDSRPGERAAAQALQQAISSRTQLPINIVQSSGTQTRWYLSVFICAQARTGAVAPSA